MTTEPGAGSHLRRSLELLWGTRDRPSRGPRPGLTLDRIVDTAIAVADAEGIDALSMRRVAGELGVGTMSLYRYVPGKAELLDLMLDRVSDPGEQVARAEDRTWREALEVAARGMYALYLTHPWLLRANWARPVFGPNTLAGLEFIVATLDGLGLTDQERVCVMTTIDGYVVGFARSQILWRAAPAETGISDEEFWRQQLPALAAAIRTGRYPALAALSEDAFALGWPDSFEFGLHRLLDGIEALVEARLGGSAGRRGE